MISRNAIYLFSPLILAVMFSCSPQKRFTRLITKHPELIQTDTIIRYDTVDVIVPKVEHDTSFLIKELYDTVYIEKDRLKVKLWRIHDTIEVNAKCDTDTVTVVREVKVPVKYYEKSTWWARNKWWIILLIIAVGIIYIYGRIKKGIS